MTRTFLSFLFALCLSSSYGQWDQIGNSVPGEHQGDAFGYVLAMDSLGTSYISSSYNNSETSYQAGSATVFSWNGEEWLQKGQVFLGNCPGEHFPSALDMSADGNVVILGNPDDDQAGSNNGIVQVYQWNGLEWDQMGPDLFGGFSDGRGSGVSLSANGHRMAIGSKRGDGLDNNAGTVKVYDWNGQSWQQVGPTMSGTVSYQAFGGAVSLNATGSTCVVAAHSTQLESEYVGAIFTYDLIDDDWVQRGETVYGSGVYTFFGGKVQVSSDGNRWAASNLLTQTTDDVPGRVRTYEWDGASWQQMGEDLVGASSDHRYGNDLDLSGDGTTLVVASPLTDSGAEDTGSVNVYTWNGISWEIMDGVIHGENEDDIAGASVGVNYDGTLVASGETGYDVPESNVGRVRVLGQCPPDQVSITACDQYELPSGAIAVTTGLYEEEIVSGGECDDLVTFDLTILQSTSLSIEGEGCYVYENPNSGEVYTETGTYYEYYTNAIGCDSVVTVQVEIKQSYATLEVTTCDSLVSPSGLYTFHESGVYQDTLINNSLCDSIITISFTKAQSSVEISESVCEMYYLPSGGEPIFESGTYTDTIPNAFGCDSLITINLTVLNNSDSYMITTMCDEYLSPDGNTYVESGIYMDTIPNVFGCDSIITTDLQILSSTFSSVDVEACFEYTAPDGLIYSESGTYESLIENVAGCDSTITIDLVVHQVNTNIEQDGAVLTAEALDAEFQWIDCGSSEEISGAVSNIFTASSNGSYACQITQNGCTENSDCVEVTSIGVQEMAEIRLSVHPNPVQNEMVIQYDGPEKVIFIFDAAGREVRHLRVKRGDNRINTSQLVPGVYFIRIGSTQVEFVKSN